MSIAVRIQTEILLPAKRFHFLCQLSSQWVTYCLIVRQLQPGLVLHGPFAQIDGCNRQQREKETDREERNRQEAIRDLAISTIMYNPTLTHAHTSSVNP